MTILTDSEIKNLFAELKILPKDYPKKLRTKAKSGQQHEEQELTIQGNQGHTFAIILRKNRIDFSDFSIILRYQDDKTGIWYNLARYNGKHFHTNTLEKNSFHDFHTHIATQRYQEAGLRIETYGEVTKTYESFDKAVEAFLKAFNFQIELPESATTLKDFGGG
ncbi:MAG: hypothetical protein AB1665_04965 [Candidatus Thermoplasmatota archaeon]